MSILVKAIARMYLSTLVHAKTAHTRVCHLVCIFTKWVYPKHLVIGLLEALFRCETYNYMYLLFETISIQQ